MKSRDLIELVAKRTDTGRCLMCCFSVSACDRTRPQCLGNLCRSARAAGPAAVDLLVYQFQDLFALAMELP